MLSWDVFSRNAQRSHQALVIRHAIQASKLLWKRTLHLNTIDFTRAANACAVKKTHTRVLADLASGLGKRGELIKVNSSHVHDLCCFAWDNAPGFATRIGAPSAKATTASSVSV
jgi:hypothetical protein